MPMGLRRTAGPGRRWTWAALIPRLSPIRHGVRYLADLPIGGRVVGAMCAVHRNQPKPVVQALLSVLSDVAGNV
jgi:hypothetical protein